MFNRRCQKELVEVLYKLRWGVRNRVGWLDLTNDERERLNSAASMLAICGRSSTPSERAAEGLYEDIDTEYTQALKELAAVEAKGRCKQLAEIRACIERVLGFEKR